jgi:hypothetical protein
MTASLAQTWSPLPITYPERVNHALSVAASPQENASHPRVEEASAGPILFWILGQAFEQLRHSRKIHEAVCSILGAARNTVQTSEAVRADAKGSIVELIEELEFTMGCDGLRSSAK